MSSPLAPCRRFLARLALVTATALLPLSPPVHAASSVEPMPDFKLRDTNLNSPRFGQTVSPRDYQMRISAFYFADSGCSYCRDQFKMLQALYKDIATNNPGLEVRIVGIGRTGGEAGNFLITAQSNVLPWLQDTAAASVWSNWAITYRDVLVLDAFNRPIARDNLTTHDLKAPANYDALKNALLVAAAPTDSDKDGLLDTWELGWFGNLTPGASDDPDGDTFDNLQEFAFGTPPTDGNSYPRFVPQLAKTGSITSLTLAFPRFSGGMLDFAVETSADLTAWSAAPADIIPVSAPTPLYNGMGTDEVRYRRATPVTGPSAGFIRVRAASKLPIE